MTLPRTFRELNEVDNDVAENVAKGERIRWTKRHGMGGSRG